jgi:NAD(P)-dependent dehydrogenase (short-subunit alcohol dehydrogenase family)
MVVKQHCRGGSLYHASKLGLEGFLDAWQELAPLKIGVTIIEPGGVFPHQARASSSTTR